MHCPCDPGTKELCFWGFFQLGLSIAVCLHPARWTFHSMMWEYLSHTLDGVWVAWGCKVNCTSVGGLCRTKEPNLHVVLSIIWSKVHYPQKNVCRLFWQCLVGHSKRCVRSKRRWQLIIWQHRKYFKTTKIATSIFFFFFDLFSLCFHILLLQIKKHLFNTSVLWQQHELELQVVKHLVP